MVNKLYKYPSQTTIRASRENVISLKKLKVGKEPIDRILRRLILLAKAK